MRKQSPLNSIKIEDFLFYFGGHRGKYKFLTGKAQMRIMKSQNHLFGKCFRKTHFENSFENYCFQNKKKIKTFHLFWKQEKKKHGNIIAIINEPKIYIFLVAVKSAAEVITFDKCTAKWNFFSKREWRLLSNFYKIITFDIYLFNYFIETFLINLCQFIFYYWKV